MPDFGTGKTSGVPKYVQIRETLRKSIERGTYKLNHRLPSDRELAERFAVSYMTARKAITDLTFLPKGERQESFYLCF